MYKVDENKVHKVPIKFRAIRKLAKMMMMNTSLDLCAEVFSFIPNLLYVDIIYFFSQNFNFTLKLET